MSAACLLMPSICITLALLFEPYGRQLGWPTAGAERNGTWPDTSPSLNFNTSLAWCGY
jgi:hypothetical protein